MGSAETISEQYWAKAGDTGFGQKTYRNRTLHAIGLFSEDHRFQPFKHQQTQLQRGTRLLCLYSRLLRHNPNLTPRHRVSTAYTLVWQWGFRPKMARFWLAAEMIARICGSALVYTECRPYSCRNTKQGVSWV